MVDLSAISELQNVSPNKNVTFRIIPWAASNNDFSHFYLGDATTSTSTNSLVVNGAVATVLPVKIKTFTAKNVNDKVDLKWQTLSEINFSHYVLERKVGNDEFKEIGIVKTANSTSGSSYQFRDDFISFEPQYYRLKMVDLDGSFEYSWVVVASPGQQKNISLSVYPNPVHTSDINATFSAASKNASLKIIGLDGRVDSEIQLREGEMSKKIDTSNLKAGFYTIIYQNSNSIQTIKFIKY
jgi:hypothetical protein